MRRCVQTFDWYCIWNKWSLLAIFSTITGCPNRCHQKTKVIVSPCYRPTAGTKQVGGEKNDDFVLTNDTQKPRQNNIQTVNENERDHQPRRGRGKNLKLNKQQKRCVRTNNNRTTINRNTLSPLSVAVPTHVTCTKQRAPLWSHHGGLKQPSRTTSSHMAPPSTPR